MLLRNDTWVVSCNPTKTIGKYRNKSRQPNTEQALRGAPPLIALNFPPWESS